MRWPTRRAGPTTSRRLTDSLAREAWKLFQQIEAEGGYAKALASGSDRKGAGGDPRRAAEGLFRRAAARWWASTTIPT